MPRATRSFDNYIRTLRRLHWAHVAKQQLSIDSTMPLQLGAMGSSIHNPYGCIVTTASIFNDDAALQTSRRTHKRRPRIAD